METQLSVEEHDHPRKIAVDNSIYEKLGDRWYEADDDPVALLRAESRLRNPWVQREILAKLGSSPQKILDVGCGGGFLSNYLAAQGHEVHGLDASGDSLNIAQGRDHTHSARYVEGDAYQLPFSAGEFDVVCAMDFLEHVEDPNKVVAEASRVLKPNGLFFFHTFSRNPLAWLVVIKGVEWFVRNTPKNMHVLRLFVNPSEVREMCELAKMEVLDLHGSRPVLNKSFFRMLATGVVPKDFAFCETKSTLLSYTGYAQKKPV